MNQNEPVKKEEELRKEFHEDSRMVGDQVAEFLHLVYPSYLVDPSDMESLLDNESTLRLESMTFFRISSCTADHADKVFESVNERFEKLFTAFYSIDIPIAYGLVSYEGVTNLVIGVYQSGGVGSVKTMMQGMLSGIELKEIKPSFQCNHREVSHGILSGIPALFLNGKKQNFSLSSIMRSLNGQEYVLLFLAKPVKQDIIFQDISKLISVRDRAFAVSKRNVARSCNYSETNSRTNSVNDSQNNVAAQAVGGAGAAVGAAVGALAGTFLAPGLGTVAGTTLGGAVGGGLGTVIGNIAGKGKSHAEGYSESVSRAITEGKTVAGDIQNGFAIELMNYADSAIERLKGGQNNGIWQTAIVYSAGSEAARNMIRACLSGELSKIDAKKLPMIAFEPEKSNADFVRIPDFLENDQPNALCSYLNSAELGLLCTVPTESVPDFELRLEKKFSLVASRAKDDNIKIGSVVDGRRILNHMPFALSARDLNKHTFVCGITGSGKSTTVKKILVEAKKPFLVIESAKKEYRNIVVDTEVYTLGKPEIHAPHMNPFYILPGVSPQVHIDYLKDLFQASFSFYGPMTYILEKCLHAVYQNKGWNLTLGCHPMLANCKSPIDFFNIEYTKQQYSNESHKFLFPTMQELKDEIARYVNEELNYDGEVAGNVKTAMKVRLENLCVGAKGYTFNTSEMIDFDQLLKKNVVFELEGFVDDSDKAFSVGLLVIFINEYRQVKREISGNQEMGLQHLLVIEEAHRLLKNVDTERLTESAGNPKGKAVEHFTNMIAEMRSYGQGVIVAEQIPVKLAPDVIKNSSTKIVQRIVSVDDQRVIANTIGVAKKDAMQLGTLETGYAYCHKEGMVLPVPVKISDYFIDEDGNRQDLDVFVSDEQLYNSQSDRFDGINLSMVRNFFGGNQQMKRMVIGFINSIMIEDEKNCEAACAAIMKYAADEIKRNDIQLTFMNDLYRVSAAYLTENIITMMVRGIYKTKKLPNDAFVNLLKETLYAPKNENIRKIRRMLQDLYEKDLAGYAKINVAALVKRSLKKNTDIRSTIQEYFVAASDNTVNNIAEMAKGGRLV